MVFKRLFRVQHGYCTLRDSPFAASWLSASGPGAGRPPSCSILHDEFDLLLLTRGRQPDCEAWRETSLPSISVEFIKGIF
jgi:hypothetical protein